MDVIDLDPRLLKRIKAHVGPVIVHLGPGFRFPGVHGGRAIHPGELHVCIEPDPEQYGLIRDMADTFEHIRRQVLVVPHTTQKAEFPASLADEVHIHNLFTQPSIRRDAGGIIALAAQWLKPGGRILIGHTLVPTFSPPNFVQDLARRKGLKFNLLASDSATPPVFPEVKNVKLPYEDQTVLEAHMGAEPTGTVHAGYFLAELRKPK